MKITRHELCFWLCDKNTSIYLFTDLRLNRSEPAAFKSEVVFLRGSAGTTDGLYSDLGKVTRIRLFPPRRARQQIGFLWRPSPSTNRLLGARDPIFRTETDPTTPRRELGQTNCRPCPPFCSMTACCQLLEPLYELLVVRVPNIETQSERQIPSTYCNQSALMKYSYGGP